MLQPRHGRILADDDQLADVIVRFAVRAANAYGIVGVVVSERHRGHYWQRADAPAIATPVVYEGGSRRGRVRRAPRSRRLMPRCDAPHGRA